MLGGHPTPLLTAIYIQTFDMTAEMDELRIFRAFHLPRIAVLQPTVGFFHLRPIDDFLAEDAVVITQAIAHTGKIKRRHRIEITSSKPSKSAVSQPGVHLVIAQVVPVDSVFLKSFPTELVGLQVDDIVTQKPSHQKLEREIVDALGVLLQIHFLRVDPTLDNPIAHSIGKCRIFIALGSVTIRLGNRIPQMPSKIFLKPRHRHLNAAVFLSYNLLFHLLFRVDVFSSRLI